MLKFIIFKLQQVENIKIFSLDCLEPINLPCGLLFDNNHTVNTLSEYIVFKRKKRSDVTA